MADTRKADNRVAKALGVTYSPEIALEIAEAIASGESLVDITARPNMPARGTVYRWLSAYPKFFDAFERALEVSAMSLEEKALAIAQSLIDSNDYTNTKVSALNYAMQQLRWSASRRDKTRYGQQAQNAVTSVPITINTTLNLGQEGQPPATDDQQSVYTIEVEVKTQTPYEDEPESNGDVIDMSETTDENGGMAFGVPETEKQDIYNPPARPRKPPRRKGHKSPAATKRTASMYAKKETDE